MKDMSLWGKTKVLVTLGVTIWLLVVCIVSINNENLAASIATGVATIVLAGSTMNTYKAAKK